MQVPPVAWGTAVSLHLYVEDVDAAFKRAVSAGAQVKMPVADMFWGDRCGFVTDPDGYSWMVATHKAEPTPADMKKAMKQMSAQAATTGS